MRQVQWTAQNEATDADGFFLQGEAAYEAERATLAEMGAPDTLSIHFLSIEPIARDEAIVEAHVSKALAEWIATELE